MIHRIDKDISELGILNSGSNGLIYFAKQTLVLEKCWWAASFGLESYGNASGNMFHWYLAEKWAK